MSKELIIPRCRFSDWQGIDNNNWSEDFPYAPSVQFRACHTSDVLVLEFDVHEKYTKAEVGEDNGKVWEDSCVEFFISFDDKGYYNFEQTCIGVALLGFRKTKPDVTHADANIMSMIKRTSSYEKKCFSEIVGDNSWRLKVEIPKEAFFAHNFKSLNGLEAKANVYKCGDGLKEAHFLSWNPIETESPNFHVPQFFGRVKFE